MNVKIRDALASDLTAINDIYSHYVLTTTATAQEIPDQLHQRLEWFRQLSEKGLPILVAELLDGNGGGGNGQVVVGWGSMSLFNDRSGYRYCLEDSVYIHKDYLSQGFGSKLMDELLSRARSAGYRQLLAKISGEQTASIRFHDSF
ncbi:L-amino acid N-acyltransferase MnaT-like [Oppia nitens]|uniref:L-amino acid N-acyltransferase MnaT-like n=1 Tax=Oppia nitens TaxID=1686743 RepID=UPI0023DA921D|nr:L-amino acid N-acyltransferase MnaT-like [Oppia nitens]